jgi:hypothetical protein
MRRGLTCGEGCCHNPLRGLGYLGSGKAADRIYPRHRNDTGGRRILFWLLSILWVKLMLGTEKRNIS